MANIAKSETLISDSITALRFPLIVAIVFIHTFIIGQPTIDGKINVNYGQFPLYDFLDYVIRICFAEIAVPLFFAISGYLFFYKCDFNYSVYKTKIQKRLRTLLVPYLLWNLIYLLYVLATQMMLPSATSQGRKMVIDYTLLDFIDSFWHYDGVDRGWGPIYGPLWFIRDLIEINLFTPIIYWLVNVKRVVPVLGMLTLYLSGLWLMTPGICVTGFSFYTLGAWASVNKIDLSRFIIEKGIFVVVISCALFVIDVLLWNQGMPHPLGHRAFIVSGVLLCVVLAIWIVSKYEVGRKIRYLAKCSFFVFVFHMFIIPIFNKCWVLLLAPVNTYTVSLALFLIPFVTCMSCIALFTVLKQLMPNTLSVLVGGR